MKAIVDIDVYNCQIRAFLPKNQRDACPTDQIGKIIWYKNVDFDRLNNRVFGFLKIKARKKAEKIVDREGGINISGMYGSIEIDEKDFIPASEELIKKC
jgi:hypothetical protein